MKECLDWACAQTTGPRFGASVGCRVSLPFQEPRRTRADTGTAIALRRTPRGGSHHSVASGLVGQLCPWVRIRLWDPTLRLREVGLEVMTAGDLGTGSDRCCSLDLGDSSSLPVGELFWELLPPISESCSVWGGRIQGGLGWTDAGGYAR